MSALLLSENSSFQCTGKFAGFFRDVFGNWRLVLRTSDEELFLGIAKPSRKRLSYVLTPGQEIMVSGNQVAGNRVSHVISDVSVDGKSALGRCIRVCSNKKCWRNGGDVIWDALNRHISRGEPGGSVEVEKSECLNNCKRGPNLECDGSLFQHCTALGVMKLVKDLRLPV